MVFTCYGRLCTTFYIEEEKENSKNNCNTKAIEKENTKQTNSYIYSFVETKPYYISVYIHINENEILYLVIL